MDLVVSWRECRGKEVSGVVEAENARAQGRGFVNPQLFGRRGDGLIRLVMGRNSVELLGFGAVLQRR